MSVEDQRCVDIISTSPGGEINLTVSDHLDWSDTRRHLRVLQDKLNAYLRFVESGEVFKEYPDAKNRRIVLHVAFLHAPHEDAKEFLAKAAKVIEDAGFTLTYRVFVPTDTPN